MSLLKEARILAAAALSFGATTALPPQTSEAGSRCAVSQSEFLGTIENIQVFLVDAQGTHPIVHDGTFTRAYHAPKVGFIFAIKGEPVICQTIWGLDMIKAYAIPSNTESLDYKHAVLPEDKNENEIPVEIAYLDDGFLVKPQDPKGFPTSSQISVVMPLGKDSYYIIRTFTSPPNSPRGDRWEIENR